jgi:alkyldihydroxyacetonephosphate synthase
MKKNLYGNIDDIVCNIKIVTCKGVVTKTNEWPRHSSGFDLNHMILGHEGNFGIITEVILRIRPLPEVSQHGSYLFKDFETGARFMEEVGKARNWPASLRLVDNIQFQFGQALKTEQSTSEHIIDGIKKFYVTKLKGYDPEKMVAATVLFEGSKELTSGQKTLIDKIAAKHNGLEAGAQNGLRGYFLTFVIAYIRDIGADFNLIAESFETSCSWK